MPRATNKTPKTAKPEKSKTKRTSKPRFTDAMLMKILQQAAAEEAADVPKAKTKRFAKKPRLDEFGEEKKCFICGATSNLVRTPCCGKWICNDEDQYVLFSYARNSCFRNHQRYTLCAAHHAEGHEGDWKTCKKCRELAEPEMVAWLGTNEYNSEKMPDPPAFEPTLCCKCGKRIVLPEGGYGYTKDGYVCDDCYEW